MHFLIFVMINDHLINKIIIADRVNPIEAKLDQAPAVKTTRPSSSSTTSSPSSVQVVSVHTAHSTY